MYKNYKINVYIYKSMKKSNIKSYKNLSTNEYQYLKIKYISMQKVKHIRK